jgi:hypothetical protein
VSPSPSRKSGWRGFRVAWITVLASAWAGVLCASELSTSVVVLARSTPGAPLMFGLIRNDSESRRVVNVSLGVDGPCGREIFRSIWDIEHQRPVDLILESKSWYVHIVPSFLAGKESLEKCNAVFETMELTPNGQRLRPVVSRKIPLLQRPLQDSREKSEGMISTETSVIGNRSLLPEAQHGASATSIEIQLRITNHSSGWRIVELADRQLSCEGASRGSWRLGSGEAISGVSAGPLPVSPGGWVVLSQRLLVEGKPSECRVRFGLEEGSDGLHRIANVETTLAPTVTKLLR